MVDLDGVLWSQLMLQSNAEVLTHRRAGNLDTLRQALIADPTGHLQAQNFSHVAYGTLSAGIRFPLPQRGILWWQNRLI